MTLEEVILKLQNHPAYIKMGKGSLSKKFHCSKEVVVEARRIVKNIIKKRSINNSSPKILIFDVETAPMKAYVWNRWNQNISLDATISEWFMICWSAKWLYSNEVLADCLTPEEALKEDDFRIIKNLWNLINEADVICAYNGKKADVKWMNSRFIVHNLNPPKPYFLVDPCDVARKSFGFSSNKLDALAGYFNIPHKLETNFQLWKDCLAGDIKALNTMLEYNKQDVKILEEVYLKMRPWIKNHPNMGNLEETKDICSYCSSKNIELLPNKYYYTSVNKYSLFRCKDCGGVSRSRKSIKNDVNIVNNLK